PLPLPARSSVTQTLPSRSTARPCGKLNSPAPRLVTNLPVGSNFTTGATFDLEQSLAPQRSNTQMLLPSRSASTAIAAPNLRPSGFFADFPPMRGGLGGEWGRGAACATPSPADSATAATTANPSAVCVFCCIVSSLFQFLTYFISRFRPTSAP